MAKKSSIARNLKRMRLVKKFSARRKALKATLVDSKTNDGDFFAAQKMLAKLPRNSSKVRVRNRCSITGRPRAVHSRFGVSRLVLRELVASGFIPGVIKSSW
ncbi:MAG: 30S ribosomal protein S14 [Puniceicoccales bacterium]|nr:30S ribosomal protein S14 [Puniceicoccales bacterium]